VRPGAILHWVATDSMLLVYCAGWVLVPGAIIAFGYALARPRTREEAAFGGVTTGLLLILFAETSLYASNGSPRFQERYFMALLPLVLPWFGLYFLRGRPARLALCLVAVILLAVSARVPLAPYGVAANKQDSPFLLGMFRLEHAVGEVNGSTVIAIAAALLSVLAVALAWRARLVLVALAVTLALAAAASAGSVSFDHHDAHDVRVAYLPADESWVDHSGLQHVLLIHTPATTHARSHELMFWNRSIDDILFYDKASNVDVFGNRRVMPDSRGRFVSGGKVLRSPLLVSNYAVRMRLRNARLVGRGPAFELWRPEGTPSLALFAGGFYYDDWLARGGSVTVWPSRGRQISGTLRLRLWLPQQTQRTPIRFRGPGVDRRVVIVPGRAKTVLIPVSGRGPWTLTFHASVGGYLDDGRSVSVKTATPVFKPS